VNQIAILTIDDRLVELLRTSGLKAGRIDSTELASYARTDEVPQVLVIDVRGRDQLPRSVAGTRAPARCSWSRRSTRA
jgi:hypothetical protein